MTNNVLKPEDLFCFLKDFTAKLQQDSRIRLRKTSYPTLGEKPQRRPGYGFSFIGYKEYEPGDDLRFLEVHKFYTSSKPLIRQFEALASDPMLILLDNSSSMYFSSYGKALHKIRCAINLAGTLSFLGFLEGIGSHFGILLSSFERNNRRVDWSVPINSETDYFDKLRHFLDIHALSITDNQLIHRVANFQALEKEIPPHLICNNLFIVSDFWYEEEELYDTLYQLAQRFRNLYLLQVLADEEINPTWPENKAWIVQNVEDIGEDNQSSPVVSSEVLVAYQNKVKEHNKKLERFAQEQGFYYKKIHVSPNIEAQQERILETVLEIRLNY
jgi:uncharacterized protein (DUF58 family)